MYVVREIAAITTSKGGEVDICVTACCPGLCKSDLGRDYAEWYLQWGLWLFEAVFARSGEQGARTLVSASLLGEDAQGKFWKDDVFKP